MQQEKNKARSYLRELLRDRHLCLPLTCPCGQKIVLHRPRQLISLDDGAVPVPLSGSARCPQCGVRLFDLPFGVSTVGKRVQAVERWIEKRVKDAESRGRVVREIREIESKDIIEVQYRNGSLWPVEHTRRRRIPSKKGRRAR